MGAEAGGAVVDNPGTRNGEPARPASWICVKELPLLAPSGLEKLQAGEQAAILLAESTGSDIVLLDEKAARRIAVARGLRVTGILGILGEAATRGLVELAPAIDRLRMTNFRSSPALLKATVDRFGKPAGMLNGKWPDQSIKLTA